MYQDRVQDKKRTDHHPHLNHVQDLQDIHHDDPGQGVRDLDHLEAEAEIARSQVILEDFQVHHLQHVIKNMIKNVLSKN